jgi:peptide/nickel transport system permease protein
VQYLEWLWRTLKLDFGDSLYFKTGVTGLVADKLPTTLLLGLLSLAFALLVSIPLGVAAAVYAHSWIDRVALALAVAGQALPNFFFALLLIMLFSIQLRWLPVSGSGTWAHFVMPTIALGYYIAPAFMRLVRAGMVEVLSADYIRTARAKGPADPHRGVQARAAQRCRAGGGAGRRASSAFLLGGSVVIETIFALDGLGYLPTRAFRIRIFRSPRPVGDAALGVLRPC